MIQQDHLQIFDLTLNVWAPLFVGNGSSYTKKEYMYNTRNGKVSFLDEQKFFQLSGRARSGGQVRAVYA